MKVKLLLCVIIVLFIFPTAGAQFYNGHQMQFGKNRVQYNSFYWTYFRHDRFDVYFNEYGAQFARYTADFATKEIERLENLFDYRLDNRIIFIVYNKLSDFRQSNIGLVTGKSESNIGGTIQIDKNKVFLYYEGDFLKFEEQITATICQVILSEMVYGNGFRDNAANSALINLPQWYTHGLISYLSKGWDFEIENRIKDGILSGKYRRFNRLQGDDARFAGHSFWQFIAETYGDGVIPNILYLTKINKSANSGFYYTLGYPLKQLSKNWYNTYSEIYSKFDTLAVPTNIMPLIGRPSKKKVYHQLKLNPSGNSLAFVTNQMGKYKVWFFDTNTNKRKKLITREHKLEQTTDYTYPVLAWHPSGRILTFITEEKGGLRLYYYTVGEKDAEWRNFLYFEKILSYSFSPDGSLLVLSAVKNGQTDIYVHNIAAGTNFQVTNDVADDFFPRFINGAKQIIFTSNRTNDFLGEGPAYEKGYTRDLFIYDYESRSDVLKRFSDVEFTNKNQPYEISNNTYISLGDQSGIVNRYVSKFDSTISFVDTAIHYRYFAETSPNTNYSRNILEQDYDRKNNKIAEVIFRNGRYYMYSGLFDRKELNHGEVAQTNFRKLQTKMLAQKDSLNKIKYVSIPLDSVLKAPIIIGSDTIKYEPEKIDINNYVFETERIKMLNEQLRNKNVHVTIVEENITKEPKARIYQKSFYQNYLVTQIDFSFLNESYQPFTGNAVYFNPGTNLLFKVGTHDLFEDYKITAGIRLPLDFQSSEYLIGLENLKGRTDKHFFFHRQTFSSNTSGEIQYSVKNISHQLFAVYRYPFSQVNSIVGNIGLRHDKGIYMPLPINSINPELDKNDINKLWISLKGEYIFDNTRHLGLNLPAGARFKIFGEFYQQANSNFRNLLVVGADFRHYTVVHRNFIWANRFAASASMGSSRLIYYLGGVDNWTNLSQRTPTFIPLSEIRLTPGVNYAFQTVATNLRGFSQNIRNGSNFALINSEFRLPIIRYFANYPLSNAFFENLQVAGFFDIGTAWTGLSPWSKQNGYDRDYINQGFSNGAPVEIEIDAQRDPVVAGYGFGFRSQLFGYFIRLDWAWGIENMQVLPKVFYFSLALDF
ncbi:MAG: hypothetical protein JXB34_12075 [Bacteroidales bacterium]|nr:hypothetical protein [Bacteroidales bacterium]